MSKNERLRQHRLERGWRQSDVAEQLDVSITTVQRWERGIQQPSLYYRARLCELFGLSAQELGLEDLTLPISVPESQPSEAEPSSGTSSVDTALWTVPYARNPHFTGREDLLEQLTQQLAPAASAGQPTTIRQVALTQAQALTGLGGIGKTQTAVEYAYRAREQESYRHILWITAASEEALLMSFVSLAEQLPDFEATAEKDPRQLARAVIEWLEQCQDPWFLILDNADDLDLLPPYLPRGGQGSVLLTTRASAVGAVALPIEVETLSVLEGTQLLLRRAQRLSDASEEEINEAGNLVIALGQFPLALDQAGAYIEETGCRVQDYLQLYQQRRHALLGRRGGHLAYPESVATTWSLSFERVEQTNPAAAELLHLCALLSPDHIPEELLTTGAPYWPPALQQAVADLFTFNQVLEVLLQFSLVKRMSKDHQLSIHRLVQIVQMESMEPQQQRQWAERVVRAVNDVFPADPRGNSAVWSLCMRYLEQAQACTLLIQLHHLQFPETADLLERTGIYLYERILYGLAEPLFLEALRLWEQQGEPDHAHIVSSLANLATLYMDQGRLAEAEPVYRRALSVHEHFVGQEDGSLAYLLQGLAILYFEQGKYAEAEPLFKRVLRTWEQQMGPEHAYVGYPLNNLAILYREQERYGEAEALFKRVLRIWEQQMGPEHPHVASVLCNLATLYCRQEKYAQSEELHLRAQQIRELQLGPENPKLIASLHGLADIYQRQGRYAQAELLYQRALRIGEQHLGPEHFKLFGPLNGLARLFLQQEQYTRAEAFSQRALNVLQKLVGPGQNHPHMASPLYILARVHTAQGNLSEAERLFRRAVRIREQQSGGTNLELAEILSDFAGFQQTQGHLSEAASLYQRALTIRESILGSDHAFIIETHKRLDAIQAELSKREH
jgi:tetratricopeptide (TPR) repeat protein/DNA-binding XRE family transcriptional regulator